MANPKTCPKCGGELTHVSSNAFNMFARYKCESCKTIFPGIDTERPMGDADKVARDYAIDAQMEAQLAADIAAEL